MYLSMFFCEGYLAKSLPSQSMGAFTQDTFTVLDLQDRDFVREDAIFVGVFIVATLVVAATAALHRCDRSL